MTDKPDEPEEGNEDAAAPAPSADSGATAEGDFESADEFVAEVADGEADGSDVGMHEMSMPPPLPRGRPAKWVMVVGLLIVLVAAGLGLLLGDVITGSPETASSTATEAPGPQAPTAEPESGDFDEPAPTRIELDLVVIGADDEPTSDEPTSDEPTSEEPTP